MHSQRAARSFVRGLEIRLNTVVEVEDMHGFYVWESSAEPSLKLHLLRLEMQPLYQDVLYHILYLFNYFQ